MADESRRGIVSRIVTWRGMRFRGIRGNADATCCGAVERRKKTCERKRGLSSRRNETRWKRVESSKHSTRVHRNGLWKCVGRGDRSDRSRHISCNFRFEGTGFPASRIYSVICDISRWMPRWRLRDWPKTSTWICRYTIDIMLKYYLQQIEMRFLRFSHLFFIYMYNIVRLIKNGPFRRC